MGSGFIKNVYSHNTLFIKYILSCESRLPDNFLYRLIPSAIPQAFYEKNFNDPDNEVAHLLAAYVININPEVDIDSYLAASFPYNPDTIEIKKSTQVLQEYKIIAQKDNLGKRIPMINADTNNNTGSKNKLKI